MVGHNANTAEDWCSICIFSYYLNVLGNQFAGWRRMLNRLKPRYVCSSHKSRYVCSSHKPRYVCSSHKPRYVCSSHKHRNVCSSHTHRNVCSSHKHTYVYAQRSFSLLRTKIYISLPCQSLVIVLCELKFYFWMIFFCYASTYDRLGPQGRKKNPHKQQGELNVKVNLGLLVF